MKDKPIVYTGTTNYSNQSSTEEQYEHSFKDTIISFAGTGFPNIFQITVSDSFVNKM